MDALTDPRIERVVFMGSARVGKTEVLNNLVGYHIAHDPAPIMIVYPNERSAIEWSKDKFLPMARDTPPVRERMRVAPDGRNPRDGSETIQHKSFIGGRLYMVGAESPAGLAAKNIRILALDEVDRYVANSGGEGDPSAQAIKRTQNFWNRKIFFCSSPKLAGTSRIEHEYSQSDQRKYHVACPHCNHNQVLEWANVKWPSEGSPEDRARAAALHCSGCGAAWTEAERHAAVRHAPDRGGGWRAQNPGSRVAGFHISVLYSPWRSIYETVLEWLTAATAEQKQAFWNTSLGLPWTDFGEAPDWERLLERMTERDPWHAPEGVQIVTAGVDVQVDRLEMYVWGWKEDLSSWLIAREVFEGDPSGPAVWDRLHSAADRCAKRGDERLPIIRIGIDTGYTATTVYSQLRRLRDHRLLALKGASASRSGSPVTGPTMVDVTERGRKLKRGLRLWNVHSGHFKIEFYRCLWLRRVGEESPPGWVDLPVWAGAEVAQQLTAEELITVKDRRGFSSVEWQKRRPRNEALDCRVYARAALWIAGADRQSSGFWARASGAAAPTAVDTSSPRAAEPQGETPGAERAAAVPVAAALQQIRFRPRGGFRRGGW